MVILAVLVLAGGVWLLGNFNIEYEYILTNNDLDIDKVIGKRKRKRMISLDVSTAEAFAPYPAETTFPPTQQCMHTQVLKPTLTILS